MAIGNGVAKMKAKVSHGEVNLGPAGKPPGPGSMTKVERYKWRMVDAPGEFRMVPKGELQVDPAYQRPETASKISAISAEWSWLACGVIQVARRPGGALFTFDGNHRVVAALRRSDIRELPCMVFETADVAEEAMGFLRSNTNRKPITAFDKFRALVLVEDPAALLLDQLIRVHDMRVRTDADGPRVVKCVACLLRLARTQPDVLRRVWPLLVQLSEEKGMHERMVEALVYAEWRLVQRGGGESLLARPWRDRVVRLGREGIVEAAARAAAFYTKGGARVWADGLVQALNRGLINRLDLSLPAEQG